MLTTTDSVVPPPSQHKQPKTTSNYHKLDSLQCRIGRTLRRIRNTKELTLRQVASKSYVAMSFISEVECGDKVASPTTIESLCKGLGITTVEFYTELITTIEKGW